MAASSEDHEGDIISESDEDYYAFLNVRREATNEEISNAYRRLSRLYHPDKHFDPVRKRHAEHLFNKTKKAYEVLSDPHSRAIYDNLGTKGLETEGWEVIQRVKTPQEIREEYERLARERDERKLQQRTNPKGSFVVSINASDLFESWTDEETGIFPDVEVSGMTISQSIEAPLTLSDTLTLGGHLQTHNGNGSGTVNCSWRTVLSAKSWSEFEIGAGNGTLVSFRFFRTLSKRSFANSALMFHATPQGIRPGLQAAIGRQLDRHTTGCLTWKAGLQSSMNTMVVWDTSSSHLACALQFSSFILKFGIPNTFAMVSYTHKFQEESKVRGSLKVGTFGVLFDYGCEKKVSQHSVLGAAMSLGIPSGVTLKLKINRGSQNYVFPIFLSDQLLPSPIFYGTFVPVITYYVVKVLIVTPYVKQQKKREAEKQKEANARKVAEKRQEAESAVALMQETFQRIWQQEEAKTGLLILKSLYGKISTESGSQVTNEVIDVSIPIQCLVKDSRLVLYESSKSQLPGFYDPCVGEDKVLFVQYKYHNLLHETTVKDDEILRIPKQSHRVDN